MRTRGLTATSLKYLACFFMLVDHATLLFYPPTLPIGAEAASIFEMLAMLGGSGLVYGEPYYLLRGLGRIAFPLFAFFVAEGCRKTRDMPGYLKRLYLFMLLTQIPFMLAIGPSNGSIMLTFFLAAAGVSFYRAAREHVWAPLAALPVLFMALMAQWTNSDYGPLAVLLVFALYLCGDNRAALLTCMTVGLFLYYQDVYFIFASVATLLLLCYNGARGNGGKWFFYWFYPLHLLILYLVRCLTWTFL